MGKALKAVLSSLVKSMTWSLGRQHTSLKIDSGLQMGASIPLNREYPVTISFFFPVLVLMLFLMWGDCWSNLGKGGSFSISCTDSSLSISLCPLSTFFRSSYLLHKDSWGCKERIILWLQDDWLPFLPVHPSPFPSQCWTGVRSVLVLAVLGWHLCTRECRAQVLWSIIFSDSRMLLLKLGHRAEQYFPLQAHLPQPCSLSISISDTCSSQVLQPVWATMGLPQCPPWKPPGGQDGSLPMVGAGQEAEPSPVALGTWPALVTASEGCPQYT